MKAPRHRSAWIGIAVLMMSYAGRAAEPTVVPFNEMEYFDRASILSSKLLELRTTISVHEKGKVINGDGSGACMAHTYRFNAKGSIVREDTDQTGTFYGYHYDDKQNLRDWSWEDKSSGELTLFSKELEGEKDTFRNGLSKTEERLSRRLSHKTDFKVASIRSISDVCFNIDAEYEIVHLKGDGGLPRSAIATLVREKRQFLKNLESPKELYIHYEYKFFE